MKKLFKTFLTIVIIFSIKTAEAIGMHFDKEYPDEANEITHVSVIYREDI